METDRPAPQPRPEAQPKPDPWPRPDAGAEAGAGPDAAGRADRRVGSRLPRSGAPERSRPPLRSRDAHDRRAPRGLPLLLRVARAICAVRRAPLIPPADDPSTLFIVAGMQPMKRWFLGAEAPPAPRVVDRRRRCMRAGGKHADLDEVGSTARHASFFEMLGNFSFGDYFKDGAITFAWEFVTEHMGFDARPALGDRVRRRPRARPRRGRGRRRRAGCDVGVPRERIVGQPRSENFWQAADTGPVRPVLRDLLRPRRGARLRRARRAARTASAASASSSSGTSSSWSTTSPPTAR